MRTDSPNSGVHQVQNPTPHSGLRRSKRVIVDLPLVVCGQTENNDPFREETFTVTISADGGLLVLRNQVTLGQKLTLLNPRTRDEREVTVAFLGPSYGGLATVGVHFAQAAPEFWAIASPPADWNLP